jgi:S-adenosylmethionine hydrolase
MVRHVREARFWRPTVCLTFHGRDIFAPVAGRLSKGLDPQELGPSVSEWARLETPAPRTIANGTVGEVLFVDPFGNLISNIPEEQVRKKPDRLLVGKHWFKRFAWVRTYAEAKSGTLAALISSDGKLEVAVVQGNAARRFRACVGTPLGVRFAR